MVWNAYRLAPGGFILSNIPNHYVDLEEERPFRVSPEGFRDLRAEPSDPQTLKKRQKSLFLGVSKRGFLGPHTLYQRQIFVEKTSKEDSR